MYSSISKFIKDWKYETDATVKLMGNITDASVEKVRALCENKNVDIALQIFWKEKACLPGLNKVYAAGKPKKIILHHWNNFFKPYDKNIEVMRDTHLDKVLKKLNNWSSIMWLET